ncbi:MAG: hypothetical protein PHG82_05405 [Candidatus Gracilibacteria bacterium]|nr:hypothetical protein [Candidatus Gracilibacteria bacterium]
MNILHNTHFYSKTSLDLIREFISEEEEQILLDKYGIEFVSYDDYETLDELIEAWKEGLLNLAIQYRQRENDPVFNPLKKYYNTFLRDIIIGIGIPDFDKEKVGILYQRYHYENVFLFELCSDVRTLFIEDSSHPYLYNSIDKGSSTNIREYLKDISLRSEIFEKPGSSMTRNDISNIIDESNQKYREESGDQYFLGLGESTWIDKINEIFCTIFNFSIKEAYEKNKKFNKDISDGLAASIELLRPFDNPRAKALVELYDSKK